MRYKSYTNTPNYLSLIILFLLLIGGLRLIIFLFGLAIALVINLLPLLVVGFIGYKLYQAITKNNRIQHSVESSTVDHQHFTEILLRIVVHIIKVDGHVNDKEISIILHYFHQKLGFSTQKTEWLTDIITTAIDDNPPLDELCATFSQEFSYESKLILLDLLYQVAAADNHLHTDELQLIQSIVQQLGIYKLDHIAIKARYITPKTKTADDTHYATLGLTPPATQEEIKKAYKTACKQHHPDKVQHLGDEFKKAAEEKMQAITAAYKALKA